MAGFMTGSRALSRQLDRRGLAGRHVAEVRAKLVDFVGGNPTETEREIINRLSMLSLQIAQMDRIIADGGKFGEDDPAHYVAFTRAYCEILKMLPQREA